MCVPTLQVGSIRMRILSLSGWYDDAAWSLPRLDFHEQVMSGLAGRAVGLVPPYVQ